MASKTGNLEADKGADVEELLDAVETLLDRVKVLYEQYFLGIQKQAPSYLHHDLERKLRDLSQIQIRNTALRYRFATVQQKFGAYNTYWRRTLRQIENGTYSRNLSRLGRQAARTGEAIPEEILAAMPKRMREQVARDRQAALAQQQRRGAGQAEAAAAAGGLELAPVDGDFELDIEEAALEDVATIHSPAPRAPAVHRLSEEDEVDVDALFAAITEGDEAPAAAGRPAAPGRPTAPGVMPAARPRSEPAPVATRSTAPGVMPAARPRSEPAPVAGAARSAPGSSPPPPPGEEDAPTFRSSQPLARELGAAPETRAAQPPTRATDRGLGAPRGLPAVSIASSGRAATDPGVGGGAKPPYVRAASSAEPAPGAPGAPARSSAGAPPPIPSAGRSAGPPAAGPPAVSSPPSRPGGAQPVGASPPSEPGATAARSRVVPPSGVPPLPTHRPPPKSEPLPTLRARPTPAIPAIPAIPAPGAPAAGGPPRSAPESVGSAGSAGSVGGPPRSAPVRAPTSSESVGSVGSAGSAGGPPRSAPVRAPTSSESVGSAGSVGGPPRSSPVRAPTSPGGSSQPPRSAPRGVSEAEVARLYEQYVRARTSIGETSDARTYDRLLRTIEQQAPKIMEEHKAKGVEFQVVVKDNQVVLRAKPKP